MSADQTPEQQPDGGSPAKLVERMGTTWLAVIAPAGAVVLAAVAGLDRLSFIRSLRVIRRQVTNQAGFSPSPTRSRSPRNN